MQAHLQQGFNGLVSYLSPAQLESLGGGAKKDKDKNVVQPPFSGDLHALGVVALEVGLMETIAQRPNSKPKSEKNMPVGESLVVKDAYERFLKKYSSEFRLVEVVKTLLALGNENSPVTESQWLNSQICRDFLKYAEGFRQGRRVLTERVISNSNEG